MPPSRLPSRLRILHVLPALSKGGGERVALDLANHAAARGHEVSILASAPVHPDVMPVALHSDISVRYVNEAPPSRLGRYVGLVPWILRNSSWLRRQDVIHCHLTFGAVVGTVVQAFRTVSFTARPAVVETYHAVGMPVPKLHRALHAWMAARRDALALMAEDPFWRRFVERRPKLLAKVIPNGVACARPTRDVDKLNGYREGVAGIPGDARTVVGSVGRLVRERRPDLYLPAFARVAREMGADVHFLLAGAGPEVEPLRKFAVELGLEENLHLPGVALDPALPMGLMDLYVTVNVGPITGIAALEAAFTGVPVVAIQLLPGYQSQPGDWIWSSTDPDEVGREIVRLLRDKHALADLGARQTAFVHAHHTVDVMAESYYALYGRVLARSVPPLGAPIHNKEH